MSATCGSAPHNALDSVPLGSKLSDLDRYYPRGAGSTGEVKTSGAFDAGRREPVSYDGWNASPEERNRFTGEIIFTHHGSTSSDINQLVYVNGRLTRKDWRFLPG